MKREYLILFCLIFGACSTTDPRIDMTPPAYVEELPAKETGAGLSNPGSLFNHRNNALFADRKAMSVNDIVTVVISETTNQQSQASKNTAKDTNIGLNGGIFMAPDGSPLSSVANEVNKYAGLGFKAGSSNEYAGSGTNTRQETFRTTISARIIKVLSNGNYFIEGSKELLLNNEKQIVQISGVIRPYDINQNNQIDSRYVSDAKIMYKTEGDLEKSTTKPWGTRFLETIWPF